MLSEASKERMKTWLSFWPESEHDLDENRKVDFINSLKAHQEKIDFDELYNCYREIKPELNENIAEERCLNWIAELEKLLCML